MGRTFESCRDRQINKTVRSDGFIYLLNIGVIRIGDTHVRSRSGRASGPNEMRMRDEIPNNRAGSAFRSIPGRFERCSAADGRFMPEDATSDRTVPKGSIGRSRLTTVPAPFSRPQAVISLIIAFNQFMPIGYTFKQIRHFGTLAEVLQQLFAAAPRIFRMCRIL